MDAIFAALGDPTRRRILEVVAGGEQSVGTIVRAVQPHAPISQPAVSQHLRVLREAGLVTVRPEGTRRLHALDEDGLTAAVAWLVRLADPLAQFAQPMDALATEVARGRRARRTERATGPAGDTDQHGGRSA